MRRVIVAALAAWGCGTCACAGGGGTAGDAPADATQADVPALATDVPAADLVDAAPAPACGDGHVDPGETCDGGTRPCGDLGTSWASGTAPCRDDCTGWSVANCVPATGPDLWETVKPAQRDPGRWGTARCNDGTPFAFRIRPSPTGSRDWVVALRGGGFCDDAAVPCLRPASLLSTPPQADGARTVPTQDIGGIHSLDPAANPVFHAANLVFAYYCSSDFWAGTSTDPHPLSTVDGPGWWFSGRHNVQAMLEALQAAYGLGDDPGVRVLFAGESSGGMGAAANIEQVTARLPRAAADGRVRLFVDSAWLVSDWDDPAMRLLLADAGDDEVIRVAAQNLALQFHGGCSREREAAPGGHPSQCLFGARWFPALVAAGQPVLVQQSLQDPTLAQYHNRPDDVAAAARYGERQQSEIHAVDPDGALRGTWFLGNAPYHGVLFEDDGMAQGAPGNSVRDVLARFWAGGPAERVEWLPQGPAVPRR